MKIRNGLWAFGAAALAVMALASCTGRRADNVEPLGETVEVVIPTGDVAFDSAVAAGNVANDSVKVL